MKLRNARRDESRPYTACRGTIYGALLSVFLAIPLNVLAESTETLAFKITSLNEQIVTVTKQYEQEKKANHDLVSRASQSEEAMKTAYTSAEKLDLLNANLNQLQEQHSSLCREWSSAYGRAVDALLIEAGRGKDPNQKGQIGKQLQRLQKQNFDLCPDHHKSIVSQEWKSIRVESYDGPQEIRQKIQLLKDISREIHIDLAQLDQQMQNFQKEKQTKERAEEFIQESTLFTDNVSIRRTGRTGDTKGPGTVSTEAATSSPEVLTRGDLYGKEQQEQFEIQYRQRKADLQSQQKELEKKISDLEKNAGKFEIP